MTIDCYYYCHAFKEKIDSLLLEDQFLVNRTGSWLKTVEWLCHLTNMAIESLQSGTQMFHDFKLMVKAM